MASRDFLELPWGDDRLIVTCDSIGAIGEQELDAVRVSGVTAGRFLARVALMELLSTGAELIALSCTFSVNPDVAAPILEGIYTETALVYANPAAITVITTEKNIPTKQTGAGVTCIGKISGSYTRTGLSQVGDLVLAVGIPKVGAEVSLNDPENADLPTLKKLLALKGVGDISPAGSKGILHEAEALAASSALSLIPTSLDTSLLTKSAGPATSLIISCRQDTFELLSDLHKPLHIIGTLKEDLNK